MSDEFAFELFAEALTHWQREDRKVRKRARHMQDADYFLAREFADVEDLKTQARAAFRCLLIAELRALQEPTR